MGTYGQEEVWLAMVPRSFTEDDGMEDDGAMEEQWRRMACLEGSNMTMSDEHYSIMVVYLAHALKEQGYRNIMGEKSFWTIHLCR